METLRLRKLLQPSHLERLLEAYVTRSGAVPEGAYQVRDPYALDPQLREVLKRVTRAGLVWSCWIAAGRATLFTGELSLDLSRERGTPVLKISLYGDDGTLTESANWVTDPSGQWTRCAD